MRNSGNTGDVIHKEVVVIGNGPSGISLSYMLSGNIPYVVSNDHPDEFLAARLAPVVHESLVRQDLRHLSEGLEGRSTNPVSLLLDSLIHPCADIGFELDPLVEWRNTGMKIDHIVLGKGPPGGSWHSMDPNILTLSLGTWMALPSFPYYARDGAEKRAFASNVAAYYEQYVKQMNLSDNFKSNMIVTNVQYIGDDTPTSNEPSKSGENKWVQKINNDVNEKKKFCSQPEKEDFQIEISTSDKPCYLTSAFNYILSRAQRRYRTDRCCKRPRDPCLMKNDFSPDRKMREVMSSENPTLCVDGSHKNKLPNLKDELRCKNCEQVNAMASLLPRRHTSRSISYSNDSEYITKCDVYSRSFNEQNTFLSLLKNSYSLDFRKVPLSKQNTSCDISISCVEPKVQKPRWLVQAFDTKMKTLVTYTCNNLVLANGTSDLPNRLSLTRNSYEDPHWLLHDLKSLEIELDLYLQQNPMSQDPVLVVGAGLSAADAVIATRARNIPVIHVFRNKSADLNKQLPENMYPEYHKVHQMMKDGGSTYPLYTALSEYTLTDISNKSRKVTLTSASGKKTEFSVSFAVVLIGSRPDLSFLPETYHLGVKKETPIDSKSNTVDIDKLNHTVKGFSNLYAIGPLAGDNFVRFLPGGALAIVSDLYKKYNQ